MKKQFSKIIKGLLFRNRCLSSIVAAVTCLHTTRKLNREIKDASDAYTADLVGEGYSRYDVLFSKYYYQATPEEYFRYKFYNLNSTGRDKYVSNEEMLRYYKSIDDPSVADILLDKYKTYIKFGQYFKRNAILVAKDGKTDEAVNFMQEYKKVVLKPLHSFGGMGVRILSCSDESEIKDALQIIKEYGDCMLEEVIQQSDAMSRFHPMSVNTLRTVTLHTGDSVEIIQASVRIGTGESVVDNGCLSASVDISTGVVVTQAREAHKSGLYTFHPDTHLQIIGYQLPDWSKAIALSCELANEIPNQVQAGWDLAYTADGWIMIEGNVHPAIQILAGDGIGARELFNRIKSTVVQRRRK